MHCGFSLTSLLNAENDCGIFHFNQYAYIQVCNFSYVLCNISHNFPHFQITEDVKFTLSYAPWKLHLFVYLSIAIATVVTIAEILKNNGLAVEKSEFL